MYVKRHEGNPNPAPTRATEGSAGFDLTYFGETYTLQPGERHLFSTGFDIALKSGTFGMITSRSGLAFKYGLAVLNSGATIDNDYRGSLGVLLINLGHEPYTINSGDKIAQLIIMEYSYPHRQILVEIDALGETTRGCGGFGSTGK